MNFAQQFKSKWVTEGLDKEAVAYCEKLGNFLYKNRLTTSQIRNVYGELKRIQMKGFDNEKTAFMLLKPKMAYATARNNNDGQKELNRVFIAAFEYVNNKDQYKNLMDLMEAILAYHKAFGGK